MTSQITGANILGSLPPTLRDELIQAYIEIERNYRARRWEPSELNAGKLCEVVYSILQGLVSGSMPTTASKPRNFVDACRALEQAGSTHPRSVRIQIPRVLIGVYEIRNNRGVGHVGGDVDANYMDAHYVLAAAKWVVSELVRIFHSTDVATATAAVESISTREMFEVWHVAGSRRVLRPRTTQLDKTLLLLYQNVKPIDETDLIAWIEVRNPSDYRTKVLRKAHQANLLHWDSTTNLVHISPLGVQDVESRLVD